MDFIWPYGESEQRFEILDRLLLGSVEGERIAPLPDLRESLHEAVSSPVASRPLNEVVHPGERVLVLAPDSHRLWVKARVWMPMVVAELNRAGVRDADIELLVATGTHQRVGYRGKMDIFGDRLPGRLRVSVHDARDPGQLAYIGRSVAGTPMWVNRRALAADKIIFTGGIVSHAFAGFSGGRKMVVPGISGMPTILANHRRALSPKRGGGVHPGAVPGLLDGNPVSEDMEDVASRLNPSFIINFVVSESGDFLGVFAGHWKEAHRRGCAFVEDAFRMPVAQKADIVLASRGGYPMDLTFYQAFQSNANAQAALKKDGVLIMVGQCSGGLGSDEFARWFDLGSLEAIEETLREDFTVPGFVVYRAAVLARKMRRLILVSDLDPALVSRIGVVPHATIQSALKEAWSLIPAGRVLCMPHASQTIPDIPC